MGIKIFKLLIINLILIFVLLILAELFFTCKKAVFYIRQSKDKKITVQRLLQKAKNIMHYQYFAYNNEFYYPEDFRETSIKYSNKPAVLFMGCSFTYGLRLDAKDTVSAQFSDLTNRTTYNFGVVGGGLREALHILRNRIKSIDRHNIEYVIYIYIADHQQRIFLNQRPSVPEFKEKDGRLYEQKIKHPFIGRTCTQWYLIRFIVVDNIMYGYNLSLPWEKTVLYLKEINREIKNMFDNNGKETRFIILVYNEAGNENWNDLSSENIQIIKLEELADINTRELPYIVWEGDEHPSKFAWETILPELIKKTDSVQ